MSKETPRPKLQPVEDENLDIWDGYRGNHDLAWRLSRKAMKHNKALEEFAVRCKCGAWWGWTYHAHAMAVLNKIQERGCLRCR
jgi:hypothetical protein